METLFNIHELLASILQELNYDAKATYRRTPHHLKQICSLSGFFIVMDESNDLDRRAWPYLKRIIDAGVPIRKSSEKILSLHIADFSSYTH